jgi:hypothetical protein
MKKGKQHPYRLAWFLPLWLLVVPVDAAGASVGGRVAAAWVREESYRHFLDDTLYTHAGDDRGIWGVEHDLARDNIASLLSSFGLTVTLHPFHCASDDSCPADIEYYNVVGEKLGTTYPERVYIIGAHFDSVSNPGADDNASGVSLVLEAARVLSAYDSEYTLRFIAFDREEQGLIGSENYAYDHITEEIVGMISTDMVAYNHGSNSVDIYGRSGSDPLKNALAQAVDTYGGGLARSIYGASGGSDHAPFEWYGFQACLLIEDWGNPHYHRAEDNVDTPDYIDYEYATRITRSVVGFLVDNAGINVDIPDADYTGNGVVDMEDYAEFQLCFSGEGVSPPNTECNFFDFDSDGDVDCADWDMFAAVWTGGGDPPEFWMCILTPPLAAGAGSRCLAVAPPEHGMPMAFLVMGDSGDGDISCLSQYVQADGSLGSDPVYRTFDAWGLVAVCDESIIPDRGYSVCCDYGEPGLPRLSEATTAFTAPWGDTVGYFTGTEWTPPDGIVRIVDIVAVLDTFRGIPTAPPVYQVDMLGTDASGIACAPDGIINVIDAIGALDGFRGISFWESTPCLPPCAK